MEVSINCNISVDTKDKPMACMELYTYIFPTSYQSICLGHKDSMGKLSYFKANDTQFM